MQNKIIVFLLFVFSVLLFTKCNDSPTDIGSGLLTQDNIEILKFDSSFDSTYQTSNSFKFVHPLSSSSIIMLGNADNVTSKTLIKFVFAFADSLKDDVLNNNIIIKDSWIELHKSYLFGDSTSGFDYSVFKVNSYWTSTFDANSSLSFDEVDLSGAKNVIGDTLYTFRIDNSLSDAWIKNYSDTVIASNNGLLISPTSGTKKIIGFTAYSIGGVSEPKLKIAIEYLGVADTIIGYVSSDISIVTGNLPIVGSENISIQPSLSSEAKLFFDLSKIPQDAVINSANLTLTIDSTETKMGANSISSLNTYILKDSSTHLIDSNYVNVLNISGNTFTGAVTTLIRALSSGLNNQGFLIKAANNYYGVEILALKGSNTADINKRPKLEIVYTRKK